MVRRILAAGFGAVLFGVLAPIGWGLLIGWPEGGFGALLTIAAIGAVAGGVLGALFPKVFGFVFEVFLEIGE